MIAPGGALLEKKPRMACPAGLFLGWYSWLVDALAAREVKEHLAAGLGAWFRKNPLSCRVKGGARSAIASRCFWVSVSELQCRSLVENSFWVRGQKMFDVIQNCPQTGCRRFGVCLLCTTARSVNLDVHAGGGRAQAPS